MDFFTTNYLHTFEAPVLIVFFVSILLFICTVGFFKTNKSALIYIISYFVVSLSVIAILVAVGVNTRNELAAKFQEDVHEAYGISLPSKAVWSLEYPSKELIADTQILGSTFLKAETEDDELELREVTLVWTDHEFRLFETNEDNTVGKELPRA